MSRLRASLAAALLVLGACGSETPTGPRWIDLAASVSAGEGESVSWVEHTLDGATWREVDGGPRLAAVHGGGRAIPFVSDRARLSVDGRPVALAEDVTREGEAGRMRPGSFALLANEVHYLPPDGQGAPARAVLSLPAERHHRGRADRPIVAGYTGRGFAVWGNESHAVRLARPAGEVALRFFLAVEGLGRTAEAARARILLDGEVLLDRELGRGADLHTSWEEVLLPAGGAGEVELRFEVRGAGLRGAFFAPTLGPGEVGTRGGRPWPQPRRDVLLVVADTLRADGLAAYGGDPAHAPALNALAAEGLVFAEAWSTSTWTLPAQASMMSGLYPEQHGATNKARGLADEAVTLAEHLRAAGYRTGAVTDSTFLSRHFGLEQGFEWFLELPTWDLRHTVAEAGRFLDADDGRPTFLFVHTYRAHTPYRSGVDEDQSPIREFLRGSPEWQAVVEGGEGAAPDFDRATREDFGARLKVYYDQGVTGLDEVLGTWLRARVDGGDLANGRLLFTSDHGESFLEHGLWGHAHQPLETQARIPLFVLGPGVPAEVRRVGASLIDVPRTVAGWAGLAPPAGWEGRDLFGPEALEPALQWCFVRAGPQNLVALRRGDRKVLATVEGLARGEVLAATELGPDGLESGSRRERPEWAEGFVREHAGALVGLVEPRLDARDIDLSPEARAMLEDLGYGGGG